MSLSLVNAIRVPFAEKAGSVSLAGPDVIGVAVAPSRVTMKMSPPREKAMLPFWPVNAASAELGAAARATRRPAARDRRRQRIMVAVILSREEGDETARGRTVRSGPSTCASGLGC